MKRTLFSLILVFFAWSALATTPIQYSCVAKSGASLTVPFENCALSNETHFDVCDVPGGILVVNTDPTKSLLVGYDRSATEVSCHESTGAVVARSSERPQASSVQSPRDPNDPQEPPRGPRGADGPGHGGSNFRNRGKPAEI